MKLRDLISPDAVTAELKSQDRDGVVHELVDLLIAAGKADAAMRDDLVARVLDREERGSTGFGKGVAVPHVKHDQVNDMAAAIGISPEGVEFNALDKKPVHSFILLLSPGLRPDEHLHAMEAIFKHLTQDGFRRFLKQATTPGEVIALLDEADSQQLSA